MHWTAEAAGCVEGHGRAAKRRKIIAGGVSRRDRWAAPIPSPEWGGRGEGSRACFERSRRVEEGEKIEIEDEIEIDGSELVACSLRLEASSSSS